MQVLKLPEVIKMTGLSRSSIYHGIQLGGFPKPIKLSKRSIGFLQEEVEEFLQFLKDQRDKYRIQ